MNAPTAGWANHWVNLSLEVTNAMHPPIRVSLELATISQGTVYRWMVRLSQELPTTTGHPSMRLSLDGVYG